MYYEIARYKTLDETLPEKVIVRVKEHDMRSWSRRWFIIEWKLNKWYSLWNELHETLYTDLGVTYTLKRDHPVFFHNKEEACKYAEELALNPELINEHIREHNAKYLKYKEMVKSFGDEKIDSGY